MIEYDCDGVGIDQEIGQCRGGNIIDEVSVKNTTNEAHLSPQQGGFREGEYIVKIMSSGTTMSEAKLDVNKSSSMDISARMVTADQSLNTEFEISVENNGNAPIKPRVRVDPPTGARETFTLDAIDAGGVVTVTRSMKPVEGDVGIELLGIQGDRLEQDTIEIRPSVDTSFSVQFNRRVDQGIYQDDFTYDVEMTIENTGNIPIQPRVEILNPDREHHFYSSGEYDVRANLLPLQPGESQTVNKDFYVKITGPADAGKPEQTDVRIYDGREMRTKTLQLP